MYKIIRNRNTGSSSKLDHDGPLGDSNYQNQFTTAPGADWTGSQTSGFVRSEQDHRAGNCSQQDRRTNSESTASGAINQTDTTSGTPKTG